MPLYPSIMNRFVIRSLLGLSIVIGLLVEPHAAWAESYVAGVGGINFADRLTDVEGTGGLLFQDLDLQNSVALGGKLGHFFRHGWFGIEGEFLHSTPHIKGITDAPGIHLRIMSVTVNLIARYPGRTFQPYVGIGGGPVIAHLREAGGVQPDSDVAGGFNAFAGLRAFVTSHIAIFGEYKYMSATFRFDNAFGPAGGFESDYRAQHLLFGVSLHF
ncbi:MAG: porin family protein [Nitrospira sp.]|nr:porin family protein [Nitrospira sp.]MCP9464700.1 porin family protein [Nitrospira sp.]